MGAVARGHGVVVAHAAGPRRAGGRQGRRGRWRAEERKRGADEAEQAAQAVLGSGPEGAVGVLLEHPDAPLHLTLKALGRRGARGAAGAWALYEALARDAEPEGRPAGRELYEAAVVELLPLVRDDADKVREVSAWALGGGVPLDTRVVSQLIVAHGKDWRGAEDVYERARRAKPSAIRESAISALVSAYGKAGEVARAERCVADAKAAGLPLNAVVYSALIKAYARDWRAAKGAFDEMCDAGHKPTVSAYSTLISAYARGGRCAEATAAMDAMRRERLSPDRFCYAGVLTTLGSRGRWADAEDTFAQMVVEGIRPNAVLYGALIYAYYNGKEYVRVEEVFQEMLANKVAATPKVHSIRISALRKTGLWEHAVEAFEDMRRAGVRPTVRTYSSLISALNQGGQWHKAAEVFADMREQGLEPSQVTYNTLISAFGAAGEWEAASEAYAAMLRCGIAPDAYTFNALITAAGNGKQRAMLERVLADMDQYGVAPNKFTCLAVISALEKMGSGENAVRLHRDMRNRSQLVDDTATCNVLLSVYAKNGDAEQALEVRDEMVQRGVELDGGSYSELLDALLRAHPVRLQTLQVAESALDEALGADLLDVEGLARDGDAPLPTLVVKGHSVGCLAMVLARWLAQWHGWSQGDDGAGKETRLAVVVDAGSGRRADQIHHAVAELLATFDFARQPVDEAVADLVGPGPLEAELGTVLAKLADGLGVGVTTLSVLSLMPPRAVVHTAPLYVGDEWRWAPDDAPPIARRSPLAPSDGQASASALRVS